MSIRTEYRYCFRCGHRYPFNPDAGQWICPRCGVAGILSLINLFEKKNL